MQTAVFKSAAGIVAAALLFPFAGIAQKGEDKEKKETRVVTVTTNGNKGEKVVVEVDGDKVTVNGKPVDELKDGDVKVKVHKLKDMQALTAITGRQGAWSFNGDSHGGGTHIMMDENKAMLGVSTEKDEKGAKVNDVTKESAAEKMGLKENDIITKINDAKIESPDDLSAAIKKHKPGDKVTVTWLRDGKESKASGELTKWKGVTAFGFSGPGQDFNFKLDDFNMGENFPRALTIPRVPGQNWSWSGGSPRLGISVQDTDDGKGVKVIEVDEESNAAKAGIKENDIVTHVDDKAVNNVDEISKLLKEKKESPTVRLQVDRNGKRQNIEVKMPRKIKTADL
jgi:serine protease Do